MLPKPKIGRKKISYNTFLYFPHMILLENRMEIFFVEDQKGIESKGHTSVGKSEDYMGKGHNYLLVIEIRRINFLYIG